MKIFKTLVCAFILIMAFGCTDLNETLYSKMSADTFYQTEEEVLSGLTNVYLKLMRVENWFYSWQLQECTTDHGMCPTRPNGAWYSAGFYFLQQAHTWDATSSRAQFLYTNYYIGIASANSFIEILNRVSIENKDVVIAEVRAIRAWEYLALIDYFGNIPIVTVATLDQNNLPTNSSRKEVFEFIESELLDAIELLPSLKDISNRKSYYPRVAKETAMAMLVRLYLNAEIYSGTNRWQDCINVCNQIVSSGVYSLAPSISDNFVPLNENCPEIIFSISQDNVRNVYVGGDLNTGGNWINQLNLKDKLRYKYNVNFNGWGGACVQEQHYNNYDDEDYRKSLILTGLQKSANGDSLMFILPIIHVNNASYDEGYVNVKYVPDPLSVADKGGRGLGRNDIVLLRYAEILMSKAEALYRLGSVAEATELINEVRDRNFVTPKPFVNMKLDDILMEFSREFSWECRRRTDLIRYGKFITLRTPWKNFDDEPYRNIFPIPQNEIQTNPNLVQNPGY